MEMYTEMHWLRVGSNGGLLYGYTSSCFHYENMQKGILDQLTISCSSKTLYHGVTFEIYIVYK